MAFQHEFADALLGPDRRAPAGIRAGRQPERERRFAVHRNNVMLSLVDALAETFPVSQALVGEEFFRAMARERVLADPPRSAVLTDYAEGFPDFIAGFAPAASVPYLADVARMEALRVQAYHAADARPVADSVYGELLTVPETLAIARLKLHPAGRWLRSAYAAYSIWQAHQGLEDLSSADLDGIDINHAEDVLVARPALAVAVTALPCGAIEFLDALADGRPLAAAFAAAQAAIGDIDHGVLFAVLIRHGLVAVVDTALEP